MVGEERRRTGWARLAELGPAWLSSIAAVIAALAAAGFFAGRLTADVSTSAAPPPTTSPAAVVTTGRAAAIDPPVATPSTSAGVELASYDVKLVDRFGFVAALTAPSQDQLLETSDTDVRLNLGNFFTRSQNKLVALPTHTSPSYAACKASPDIIRVVQNPAPGTGFCVIMQTMVIGVRVTEVQSSPPHAVVHATLWQY
ncbi:hypothetical protein Lfu02_02050 [Longispora fulva]|uniref:Uncharacterized protein n=1 Tax=Longispora fulva TaxID=619741 RepID=A0A8J7GGV1_9ACTN|nr:hypothetical protein [Longispora fulva]MBG6135923.1 hypothetical protein [Longispora fulva]GIG55833.1 hypothetical protein Lfu02_02050 [Longispora fulva]